MILKQVEKRRLLEVAERVVSRYIEGMFNVNSILAQFTDCINGAEDPNRLG